MVGGDVGGKKKVWREKNCVELLADVALSSTLITQKWVFAIWGLCWYNFILFCYLDMVLEECCGIIGVFVF